MSLKRLAIRAKKSLSGLHANNNAMDSTFQDEPLKTSTNCIEDSSTSYNEFGTCISPERDSPSKRNRLLGSLRRMKSSIGRTRGSPTSYEDVDSMPTTPTRAVTVRPSLALDFEISPPDRPIFYSGRNSSNSSNLDIQHSSPITVPVSSKRPGSGSHSTPPADRSFIVGTIPDSPAPLQRASVQKAIINNARSESDVERAAPPPLWYTEVDTPMPGTNFTLEEIETPKIVVSDASASDTQAHHEDGCFAMNITEEKEVEHSRVLSANERAEILKSMVSLDPIFQRCSDIAQSTIASTSQSDEDSFVFDEGTRRSFEDNKRLVNAYIARTEIEMAAGGIKRRCSNWGRNTGLYDGTGYGLGDDTATTSSRAPTSSFADTDTTGDTTEDEVSQRIVQALDAVAVYQARADAGEENSSPISEQAPAIDDQLGDVEEPLPLDEKEALQEIIRAYANHPMMYDDEAKEDQMVLPAPDQVEQLFTNEEAKAREEVVLSIRIMNRSLGG